MKIVFYILMVFCILDPKFYLEEFYLTRRIKNKRLMIVRDYIMARKEQEVFNLKNLMNEFKNLNITGHEIRKIFLQLMEEEKIPEFFEIIDKDTVHPMGILKQRKAVHRDGDWHLAVSVLIFDKEGNLLLQKRSPAVAEPNRWEVSASGHIAPGENNYDAIIREMEEEIGLRIKANGLTYIGKPYQFIKVGRVDVEKDHFEGNVFFHHSDDPPNNRERLSLFIYIVSEEEKRQLLEFARTHKSKDVSEVKFEDLNVVLEDFRKNRSLYSSAFTMYFGQDWVINEIYKYLASSFRNKEN